MKLWLKKNKNKIVFVGFLCSQNILFSAVVDPAMAAMGTPAATTPAPAIPASTDSAPAAMGTPAVAMPAPATQAPTDPAVATMGTPEATTPAPATPVSTDPAMAAMGTPAATTSAPATQAPATTDAAKGMIKEETPDAAKIVISEGVQPIFKESSSLMQSMQQELGDINKTLDDLRAQHRAIDQKLDAFYEELGGMLGKLAINGERLKVHMDKKNEYLQKQPYAIASQLIVKLQALMPQLGDYKGALDKIKSAQTEIDVSEDAMREKIASLNGSFSDLSKLVQESAKVRNDIPAAIDETKAKELLAKMSANLATIKSKKNDFKSGPAQEIARIGEKINDQMKSLKEQAVAQDSKIKGLQAEVDGLVLPKSDIVAKVEPLVESKKNSEGSLAADKTTVNQPIVLHKKVKIPEKSNVRLMMESVRQAFADIYQSGKDVALGIVSKISSPRTKEQIQPQGLRTEKTVAPATSELPKGTALPANSVAVDERTKYVELMKQERQAQLERIKKLDADLKAQGIEVHAS